MTTRIKRSLLEITATALMARVCLIPTIDGDAAAKKVKVSKNTVTVKEKAKATITVKNAGKKKVTAKLANKKIAKIKVKKNKITVTGKKAGNCGLCLRCIESYAHQRCDDCRCFHDCGRCQFSDCE